MFFDKSASEKIFKIESLLKEIQLLVPTTKSPLVIQLQECKKELLQGELQSLNPEQLAQIYKDAKRLAHNLKLAKEAVDYTKERMTATNKPYSARANTMLEGIREQLNNKKIVATYQTLKERRTLLGKSDPVIAEFEQTAYRKSTGFNMTLWYHYAHFQKSEGKNCLEPNNPGKKKKEKQLGNCSEQCNVAFVFGYSLVREASSAGQPPPIERMERIDVDNNIGGHSYLLFDRKPVDNLSTTETYPAHIFLNAAEYFGSTCVVVDPWDTEHPFYPISDIAENMPSCGLKGSVNFEFSLDFSTQEQPPLTCRL